MHACGGARGRLEIRDFDLEQVLETTVDVSKMQPVLYAIESFEQIFEATKEAEGRLGSLTCGGGVDTLDV